MVLEASSCSLGTDLPAADAVIIYDSDGHPGGDIQRYGCARRLGDPEKILVLRLYCSGTLEEVIVSGGSGANALSKALRPTTHRLSAADARLLEESLRFGVSHLFAGDPADCDGADGGGETALPADTSTAEPQANGAAAAGDTAVKAEVVAEDRQGGATAAGDVSMAADNDGGGGGVLSGVRQVAQEPPALRPRVMQPPDEARLRGMVQGLERLLAELPPGPLDAAPAEYEDAFAGSFLRDWRQLDNSGHRYEQNQEDEGEEEVPETEDAEDAGDKLSVSALASSSAAFWQRMLKNRWQALQAEEAEAAAAADGAGGAAAGAAEGEADPDVSASERDAAARAAAEEAPRTSNSQGSELAEPSDGRGGRAARQTRARRAPKRRYDDDSPPPPTPAGGAHHTATSHGVDADDAAAAAAAAAAPAAKRGRVGGGGFATAPTPAADAAAPVATPPLARAAQPHELQAPQQMLINLRTQFENMMNSLKDPGSLVNSIFTRAQERILSMVNDAGLNLADERDRAVYNFALQAAQILLIMRPQNELPSDFQDYTLVALIAVAAHLSGHKIGSDEGINSLASMYQQAPVDLRSVFNHILGQMREYRNHTEMMKTLDVAVSFVEPSAAEAAHEGARPPADAFEAEMEAIARVASDVAAVNAGPLAEDAVADFNYRMAWVSSVAATPAGQAPDARALVDAVREWAVVKRGIVMADMAQRWRVDAVTQRYQQHMEKVRSCAQRIIDTVNESFKAEREGLDAQATALFTRMRALAAQSPIGAHLKAHLSAAPPPPVAAAAATGAGQD